MAPSSTIRSGGRADSADSFTKARDMGPILLLTLSLSKGLAPIWVVLSCSTKIESCAKSRFASGARTKSPQLGNNRCQLLTEVIGETIAGLSHRRRGAAVRGARSRTATRIGGYFLVRFLGDDMDAGWGLRRATSASWASFSNRSARSRAVLSSLAADSAATCCLTRDVLRSQVMK